MPQVIPDDLIYAPGQRLGLYRWHITDPIRFEEDLKVTIQALGWQKTAEGRSAYLQLEADISAAISRAGSSASHFARAAVGDLRAEAEALTLAAAGLSGRPAWRTAGSSCTEVAGIRCQHRCSRALKILTLGT